MNRRIFFEKLFKTTVAISIAPKVIAELAVIPKPVVVDDYSRFALPLVRRVFGKIEAKEFISVMPMSMPTGLVHYLDYKYTSEDINNKVEKSGRGGFLGRRKSKTVDELYDEMFPV
jgi:hypothetical protein